MCNRIFVTAVVLASLMTCPQAIGARNHLLQAEGVVSLEDLRRNLLQELADALGHHGKDDRLARLEAQLRPMCSALPRNEHGGFDHAVVRYALHRFFVQQHGWYIKGLEPAGDTWNASSPTGVFKDHVPSYIQAMLEEHLGMKGLGLQELVVLAATLEDLVHGEAVERLSTAYAANRISIDTRLSEAEAQLLIKTYMMMLILPHGNYSTAGPRDIKQQLDIAPEVYPGWEDTLMWAHDVWKGIQHVERTRHNPFVSTDMDFASTVHVVEEIGEKYGRFQDFECRDLKNELLKLEDRDTGRVRLGAFYKGSLDGAFQFTESADYLRHLGALDEMDRNRPSVVIPNYITSRSNCLVSSSFYSICCMDECEGLMRHLEGEIAGPTATPHRVAELVSALPSDTVDAPRNLSSSLLRRLDGIAAIHDGNIPLHGRMFAQWMHHAYPRECPYPHVAGALEAPRTADEWMAHTGGTQSVHLSADEMRTVTSTFAEQNNTAAREGEREALPWTEAEELVTVRKVRSPVALWRTVMFYGAILALLVSTMRSILRTAGTAFRGFSAFKGAHGKQPEPSLFAESFLQGKSHMV